MVAHYYQELLNYFARMVRSRDTAADLVHEAYARVLALQRSGEAVAQPRALLYRTARNLLIDQHRRNVARGTLHTDADDSLPDVSELPAPAVCEPEAAFTSAQGVASMIATIESLPLRCREAFILHKFDGLSQAEVAVQMGISRKMVEQHIQRAMVACRACRSTAQGEDLP